NGSSFSFELQPGEERLLSNQDLKISANRVRVCANSESRKWQRYRDQDLWLVPEVENDLHQYKAGSTETFTYRLALQAESADAVPAADPDASPVATKV